MMHCRKFYLYVLVSTFLCCSTVIAQSQCNPIGKFIDVNCDGEIRYVFTGDSIVQGYGDEKNRGGYPGRLQRKLPDIVVERIGKRGATTQKLYSLFKKSFAKNGKIADRVANADVIVIEAGTNDLWLKKPTALTRRNLRRISGLLEDAFIARQGYSPYISVTTLLPANRGYQQPFIEEVNTLLLEWKQQLKIVIRFDRLPKTILSEDNLHPNSFGYSVMAKLAKRRIVKKMQREVDQFLTTEAS